jgi:hypothetical protein
MNQLEKRFQEFHQKNPQVYELWKRFCNEAINAGRKVLSAGLIAERIRWETEVITQGDKFKLNNNHRAYYARLFMRDNPQHDGIFKTRVVNGAIPAYAQDAAV